MDLQLSGKRALVTGSSSGIGRAIAKTLAGEGFAGAIHGRDEERARQVVREVEAGGGRAVVVLGDLAEDAAAGRVADTAVSLLGGIDILVNNAGGSGEKKPWGGDRPRRLGGHAQRNVLAGRDRGVRRIAPELHAPGRRLTPSSAKSAPRRLEAGTGSLRRYASLLRCDQSHMRIDRVGLVIYSAAHIVLTNYDKGDLWESLMARLR